MLRYSRFRDPKIRNYCIVIPYIIFIATICKEHGPSHRRSARGARSADSGRFGLKLGGLTRYPRDPRSRYAVFGPCDNQLLHAILHSLVRVFVIFLRLSGAGYRSAAVAIVSPAGETHAVNWRSNVVPVDLGKWLLFDILRQIGQIDGSLVQLVSVRWVSGHEIDGARSFSTVHGPWIAGP